MTVLTPVTMAQLIAGSIICFAARTPQITATPQTATTLPAPKDTVQ